MRLYLSGMLLCFGWALLVDGSARAGAADPAPASSVPVTTLPRPEELVERWVKAIGGRSRLEKLTSRVVEGEVEMSALPGTLTLQVFSKAPDRQLSIIQRPGFGELIEGFDGTNGWVKNPFVGLSDRPAEEMPKVRRDAQFNRELNFTTLYPDLVVVRLHQAGGEDAYVAESHPSPRSLERFYFAKGSGLLVRQDSEFDTAGGRISASALYEDYREAADGVRLPHLIRITARGPQGTDMTLTLRVKSVKHNVPIEEARFRRPAV